MWFIDGFAKSEVYIHSGLDYKTKFILSLSTSFSGSHQGTNVLGRTAVIPYIVDYITAEGELILCFARCRLKSLLECFTVLFNTIRVVDKANSRDFV